MVLFSAMHGHVVSKVLTRLDNLLYNYLLWIYIAAFCGQALRVCCKKLKWTD